MVSQALAQAILNQRAPDVVGAFRAGQKESRQREVGRLAGLAMRQGGGLALDELTDLDPDVAFSLGEQLRARSAQDINDFLRDSKIALAKLNANDPQGALEFAKQRRDALRLQNRDTTQTDQFINQLESGRVDQARQELMALTGAVDQARLPAGLREFEALTAGLPEQDVDRARRIRLGLEAREAISPEELAERERRKLEVQEELKPRIKAGEAAATGISGRKQGFIDSGVEAADSVANIRRSLDLLKTVKTGGFNAAALRAKQLFGIEGADEGELSANLGRSVLAQLRPIFGAAFTAAEGERLERISEGFGRNAATNRRLLSNALEVARRAARRGISAAEDEGDNFTANEIRKALDLAESIEPQEVSQEGPRIRVIRIK